MLHQTFNALFSLSLFFYSTIHFFLLLICCFFYPYIVFQSMLLRLFIYNFFLLIIFIGPWHTQMVFFPLCLFFCIVWPGTSCENRFSCIPFTYKCNRHFTRYIFNCCHYPAIRWKSNRLRTYEVSIVRFHCFFTFESYNVMLVNEEKCDEKHFPVENRRFVSVLKVELSHRVPRLNWSSLRKILIFHLSKFSRIEPFSFDRWVIFLPNDFSSNFFFLFLFVTHLLIFSNRDIPEDVLNTYCWIHSTYTVVDAFMKKQGLEVPFPGIDNSQGGRGPLTIKHNKYYQWVAFTLFFQVSITILLIFNQLKFKNYLQTFPKSTGSGHEFFAFFFKNVCVVDMITLQRICLAYVKKNCAV